MRLTSTFARLVPLALACAGTLAPAHAQTQVPPAPTGPANFAAHKSAILANIDQRLQKLQEHKACIAAAQDGAALRACRVTMKSFHESERAERLQKRAARRH